MQGNSDSDVVSSSPSCENLMLLKNRDAEELESLWHDLRFRVRYGRH